MLPCCNLLEPIVVQGRSYDALVPLIQNPSELHYIKAPNTANIASCSSYMALRFLEAPLKEPLKGPLKGIAGDLALRHPRLQKTIQPLLERGCRPKQLAPCLLKGDAGGPKRGEAGFMRAKIKTHEKGL